ncbi:MAG: hypothetical protein HXY38_00945 [Chloroflexi bacterium]|nr:hypothetical protein [Chloroflexota bacterium]
MLPIKFSFTPYVLPKLSDMLFIAIFASVLLYGPRLFNLDGDLGRHIAIGNYMIQEGTIPVRDVFSHSMEGESLVPHEWIAQIAFAISDRWLGLNGPVLLTAMIISLAFAIKFKESTERGAPLLIAAVILVWAAVASSIHWLARPHIFTLLFLSLWSYQLEKLHTEKPICLIFFPALMLLWANTHGAFIAGFVVWGAHFFEWMVQTRREVVDWKKGKQLALIGASSFAVTLINPSGYLLWTTSIGYIRNRYLTSHTVEYMPPNFQDPAMWPFAFMIVYGLLSLSARKTLPLRDALLMAGWTFMSLFSMRNIPLFAMLSVPIFAYLLHIQTNSLTALTRFQDRLSKVEDQLKSGVWSAVVVFALGLKLTRGVSLDTAQAGNRYDPAVFPVQSVDWLLANPQTGNMFNHFPWGGYLLYRAYPDYRVFIDGQTDFYGESLTREYEAVISLSQGWQGILEKYAIDWAIVESNSPLAEALAQNGWEILYKDETAIIIRK